MLTPYKVVYNHAPGPCHKVEGIGELFKSNITYQKKEYYYNVITIKEIKPHWKR